MPEKKTASETGATSSQGRGSTLRTCYAMFRTEIAYVTPYGGKSRDGTIPGTSEPSHPARSYQREGMAARLAVLTYSYGPTSVIRRQSSAPSATTTGIPPDPPDSPEPAKV
eukprot:1823344-Rhodomonas_salina.3